MYSSSKSIQRHSKLLTLIALSFITGWCIASLQPNIKNSKSVEKAIQNRVNKGTNKSKTSLKETPGPQTPLDQLKTPIEKHILALKQSHPTLHPHLDSVPENPALQSLINDVFYTDDNLTPDVFAIIDKVDEVLRSDIKSSYELSFSRQTLQRVALLQNTNEYEREALLTKWQEVLEKTEPENLSPEEQSEFLKSKLLLAEFSNDFDSVRELLGKTQLLDPTWKGVSGIEAWLNLRNSSDIDSWNLTQQLTTDDELRKLVIELPPG